MTIYARLNTDDPAELLTPWVHAIAHHRIIGHLRRTRASRADMPVEKADDVITKDDHVGTESAYDLARLRAAQQP